MKTREGELMSNGDQVGEREMRTLPCTALLAMFRHLAFVVNAMRMYL